jgi:hypothetical protein
VLGEPHDLGAATRAQIGKGDELCVLGLLDVRLDRPSMGAAVGMPQSLVHPLDHVVRERVAELVGMHVGLGGGVAHEIRQEALDQTVLADDPLGPLDPGRRQDRLLVLAPLDEPFGLEALQHLPGRCPGDAEHLGNPRGDRIRRRRRPVFADREGQKVDRLEVLVDRMSLPVRHDSPPD